MAFLEGLKKIIPAKVAEDCCYFDLKISATTSSSEIKFEVDNTNKVLILFLNKLTVKDKGILKKHLKINFDDGKIRFVEGEKVDLIERLIEYNKGDDGNTLEFFRTLLAPNDLLALRDSLFLKDEFLKGFNISRLKQDIAYSYGPRGNIICNLCTAGYFEKIMIPLYNTDPKEFHEFYDMAVERGVKALFVNAGMTVSHITQEIERRIISARSSGLKSINVHGLGTKNIDNITKSLIKLKKDDKVKFLDKNIYTKEKVIIVEIII